MIGYGRTPVRCRVVPDLVSVGSVQADGTSATGHDRVSDIVTGGGVAEGTNAPEPRPTRFIGTVTISADRPARDIHQIVEGIIEQLTTLPGSEVSLRLEIDAEVPSGLDRAKVRTLTENATTLGFIDKVIK